MPEKRSAREPEFEILLSVTAKEHVELFKLIAASPISNGLGRVYAAVGQYVCDDRGLAPENVHYTRPAWAEDEG